MTLRVSGWEEKQVAEAEVEQLRGQGVRWLIPVDIAVSPLVTEAGMQRNQWPEGGYKWLSGGNREQHRKRFRAHLLRAWTSKFSVLSGVGRMPHIPADGTETTGLLLEKLRAKLQSLK